MLSTPNYFHPTIYKTFLVSDLKQSWSDDITNEIINSKKQKNPILYVNLD